MDSVRLPGGAWSGGERHCEARLRPLVGEDEALLADAPPGLAPAGRATLLLARCLESVGPHAATPDLVRGLTVGDREALLLQLRQRTLGDRLPCVLSCPACREPMDLDLRVSGLLVDRYPEWAPSWTARLGDADGGREVRFRLPTGADQEAVAPLARRDPAAAADALLRRCVEGEPPEDPAAVAELGARMSALDAQAEILLSLACPSCSHPFEALLDATAYLLQELTQDPRRLDREIHLLAFHYHWSPRDILALTPRKRRVFLELLEDALSGEVRA